MKQVGHLPGVFMDRGHDDVGRFFVVELNDIFAHVGLKAFNALGAEHMVHLHLFADHRLAFDHLFGGAAAGDGHDDFIGFVDGFSPMNLHAITGQVGFQAFQQVRQFGQGAGADGVAQGAQVFALMGVAEGNSALGHQRIHRTAKVVSQLLVTQGFVSALAEVFFDRDGGDQGAGVHWPPPVRCHRKLARCWPRRDSFCFSSEPLIFIRQPQSAVST